MKNKTVVFFILLFFASMTLGKGVSDYEAPPSFEYDLKGSVLTNTGSPQRGAAIFFDLAAGDTSFAVSSYNSTVTNDSGVFNIHLGVSSEFNNGVRIVVTDGKDTTRGPWVFIDSASRKEETEVITTNDCNSHKKIIPVVEIYTFPPQKIIFP